MLVTCISFRNYKQRLIFASKPQLSHLAVDSLQFNRSFEQYKLPTGDEQSITLQPVKFLSQNYSKI